jgi:hypothetical protein
MENIEAMLCGYIEGDLDEAGRAQIEKHLRENPQHQKLIDDLLATRELVRSLPRVRAPMDVGESLRGQVERSILLDDSAGKAAPRETVSRLPHLMAIAAIFLLCAALCLILYKALGPTFKPPAYTENIQTKVPAAVDSLMSAASPPANFKMPMPSAGVSDTNLPANPATDAPTPETLGLPPQFDVASLQTRLANAGYALNAGTVSAPLVLVVQGDDVKTTSADVAQALSTAGVTWSRVPQESAANPALPTLAAGPEAERLVETQKQVATTQAAEALAERDANLSQQAFAAQAVREQYSAAPTTQMVSVGQKAQPSAGTAPVGAVADLMKDGKSTAAASDIYVLRGLTSDQAAQLRKNIADADEVDTLYVQNGITAATTQATAITAVPTDVAGLVTDKSRLAGAAPGENPGAVGGFGGGGGGAAPTTSPSALADAYGSNLTARTANNASNGPSTLNGAMSLASTPPAGDPSAPATVDAIIVVEPSPPDAEASTQPSVSTPPSMNLAPPTTPGDVPAPATQP